MSKETAIQYAHSSLNLQMGCDGCELWNKSNRSCYAGAQTAKYAGRKGWPVNFATPTIFPERMKDAESWGDPTPKEREGKPWIPESYPRIVFLNDMGDTFATGLPEDWLAAYFARIAATPHIYLVLTKRPSRFAALSQRHDLPANVWPGTTVTSARTLNRIDALRDVKCAGTRWLSVEPMWEPLDFSGKLGGIGWATFGGESRQSNDQAVHPFDLLAVGRAIGECRKQGVAPFIKQLGTSPIFGMSASERPALRLPDLHGGDWAAWPASLRIREYPKLQVIEQPSFL